MKHVKAKSVGATSLALYGDRADTPLPHMNKNDVVLSHKRGGIELPERDSGSLSGMVQFTNVSDPAPEVRYAQPVWQVNHRLMK